MKQGYESWLIQIVDSGGGVLKTFDFVNRGKGPVGVEAIADNPANAVTADMFVERRVGQLEKITEGANTGYRLKGANPANYGDIGSNAIDLSISTGASGNRGATGTHSFAVGQNSRASGQ